MLCSIARSEICGGGVEDVGLAVWRGGFRLRGSVVWFGQVFSGWARKRSSALKREVQGLGDCRIERRQALGKTMVKTWLLVLATRLGPSSGTGMTGKLLRENLVHITVLSTYISYAPSNYSIYLKVSTSVATPRPICTHATSKTNTKTPKSKIHPSPKRPRSNVTHQVQPAPYTHILKLLTRLNLHSRHSPQPPPCHQTPSSKHLSTPACSPRHSQSGPSQDSCSRDGS